MNPVADPSPEFGPYEVYERLGMGGMAMVHRAKKRGIEGFERSVALKRMLQHLAEDANFVESFIREAKVASLLQHPNIAQVYDFGRIGGVYYIAMELVTGFDLRKLLRYASKTGDPIPMPVILSILGELCDALEYAHTFVDEHGTPLRIVHRDISPSNLIIAHTGHLKVIDFGIAKANSRQLQTESGQVKGKLGYMSPEAALGMPLDPVSDIFSMGVVAWELVTASPLFSARTDYETMRRIREADITPPSYHNPACPRELDSIIVAALDRESTRRLPSAAVFRAAIDALATQHGIHHGARSVADWMVRFAQPGDAWARPSTSARHVPPEIPTSVQRPKTSSQSGSKLQRSPEQAKLATEIWGDDVPVMTGADFSFAAARRHASPTPPPPISGQLPLQAPRLTPQPNLYPQLPPSGELLRVPMYTPTAHPPAEPSSKKSLVILGVLVVVAAGLGGVLLLKKLKTDPAPPPAQVVVDDKVRFNVMPDDAIVEIAGTEAGREAQLEPGVYTVSVRKDGYKTWSSTITVVRGEAQTINVELERGVAHIALDSEPAGLPIVIDGKPSPYKTPAKFDLPAGPHELSVKSGSDVWTEQVNATVDGTHAFTAMLDAKVAAVDKPKDREKAKDKDKKPQVAATDRKPKEPDVKASPQPADPPPPDAAPAPVTPDPPPVVKPDPPPPVKPARTPVVSARAVTKISGEVPAINVPGNESNGDALVKMCIDETGKVTSVKVVKSTANIADPLSRALQSWRYKPYVGKDNEPSAVCFPLQLRLVFKRGG